jgi:hypothetical protein
LLDPQASPWEKLYVAGVDNAFITILGFDCSAFNQLELLFRPYFNTLTPWTLHSRFRLRKIHQNRALGGRPRKVNSRSCLALCLAWYRFSGKEFTLQGWFGLTGTPLNKWLHFARLIIVLMLKCDVSRIRFPNDDMIELYKSLVQRKHPRLTNVYCFGDGLKIPIEAPSDDAEQKRFYNAWKSSHYISNLFFFAPDGMIIGSVLNAPGSFHDSTLCQIGKFYDKLIETYERTGGRCVMDSAFAARDNPSIIISAQSLVNAEGALEVLIHQEATSLRQAAEWGMRGLQSAFPRIKQPMKYETKGERRLILINVQMLYNYRCFHVGLNQIKTVYFPEWNKNHNADGRYLP